MAEVMITKPIERRPIAILLPASERTDENVC